MKKLLNRILKFVGINVVKAKRTRVKKAVKYVTVPGPQGPCGPVGSPGNPGKTHYVGDGCTGGHVDASPTQDNNITGPTA